MGSVTVLNRLDVGADLVIRDVKSRVKRGDLRVSDVLKPIVQLAKDYGVSVRQVREAMRRLSEEGIVRCCPHVGARIVGCGRSECRKKVLFLSVDDGDSVSLNMVLAALQRRLVTRGVQFETLTFDRQRDGQLDCSDLRLMLRRGFDLALCYMDSRQIARVLVDNGLPFVVAGYVPDKIEGAVDSFCSWDDRPAVEGMVAACRQAGVRSVVAIGQGRMNVVHWVPKFAAAGIRVTQLMSPPFSGAACNVTNSERAGHSLTKRLLQQGKLPDLVYYADDFIARGGMLALTEAGIRIPKDLKVATFSLKNYRFFSTATLARIEIDNARIGRTLADYVCRLLEGKPVSRPSVPLAFISANWRS